MDGSPFLDFKTYFLEILEYCMTLGLEEDRFWNMSLDEIMRYLNAKNKETKRRQIEKAQDNYMLARMILDNVACLMDKNHKPAEFVETFSYLFTEEEIEDYNKQKAEMEMKRWAEQFKGFAETHNIKQKGEW